MERAMGVLALVLAIVALGSALIPRWRGRISWKGTRIPAGPVSSIGFGLVFGGAGLLLLTGGDQSVTSTSMLLAGLLGILIGYWRDCRR